MIDHKEEIVVDGHHQLPAGPERKELPPPGAESERPRRRRSRAWIWLLLLLVAGGLGYRAYENTRRKNAAAAAAQERRAANRTIPVAAAAARRGDLPIYLRGLGTVDPYNTVNVRARVDGPITAVLFKEGQMVTKGQTLVQIDPRTFNATVAQAEGQLARDQAQLHDAEANLARYQKLWEAGVIARQQLDTQAATVGQFQGAIEADQAAISSARLQAGFTDVTAPISGRIGLRQVDVGNIVHPTDQNPIAVITQIQPIAVLFTIPADSLPPVLAKLRAGAHLSVEAWDRADLKKLATGTLETVDNQIDPQTGTSRLKAVFENQDGSLFPQQFVNARMLLETRRAITLIPAPAVQHGPQGSYVYVANANGTANMRQITTGVSEGTDVQVTSGVVPGDLVVVDGQDKLQEGSRIEARTEQPSGGGRRSRSGGTAPKDATGISGGRSAPASGAGGGPTR